MTLSLEVGYSSLQVVVLFIRTKVLVKVLILGWQSFVGKDQTII
jgi:hypothetical protein